jgi:hypothetical protein
MFVSLIAMFDGFDRDVSGFDRDVSGFDRDVCGLIAMFLGAIAYFLDLIAIAVRPARMFLGAIALIVRSKPSVRTESLLPCNSPRTPMDPITLATIALTLLATKATEKVGEKLGEGTLTEAKKLLDKLRHTAPATVQRLEAATDPTVIDAEIVEEVRQAAAQDPTVEAAVQATAKALLNQPGGMTNINLGKAANVGIVLNQTNTF